MLDRKGLASRDRWPERMDVVDWETSRAVEGREHLVEDEASQDALKGKYEEQHLVESDQDGYTRPSVMLALSKPIKQANRLPSHRRIREEVGPIARLEGSTRHPLRA